MPSCPTAPRAPACASGPSVLVVAHDGHSIHFPDHPELVGQSPWEWCWCDSGRAKWREAFVQACMFRRSQDAVEVSLRIDDREVVYRTWLAPTGSDQVVCRLYRAATFRLTRQEQAVLDLVTAGASNDAIAESLNIASTTVRTYLAAIRRKLRVSRAEQVCAAAMGAIGDSLA